MTSKPELLGVWIHAHEEDEGEVRVYRRRGYPLPRARGRDAFELRENGEFVRYVPGGADRPRAVEGRWTYREPALVEVVDAGGSGAGAFAMRVISCSPDLLKVRLVSSEHA